jgi:L-asparaginase II
MQNFGIFAVDGQEEVRAMDNPVLVEIMRGDRIESRHRGAIAVTDAEGKLVLALGDVSAPVYPRSAVKPLQVLPLVASGAAERIGLSAAEIALACASHSGEPVHTDAATAMLAKLGRDCSCLECGAHWPIAESAQHALIVRGQRPKAVHNNCSGKHAGFICLAIDLGTDPKNYISADHLVQQRVKAALERATNTSLTTASRGIDGCSIPTYAVPLTGLATAFAKLATGIGFSAEEVAAAERVRACVAQHPYMVAGAGRFDTAVMEVLGGRALTKTGAEGVFCAALPESGLGIALKCEDGSTRAAELMMATILARFVPFRAADREHLSARLSPVLTNWNNVVVGCMRPAGPLLVSMAH